MTTCENTTVSLSILVVDDEPNIRKILAMALEVDGHRVTSVSNAKDAVNESNRRFFNLAFVDLRLGTESGMELISTLCAACPWMKIIVITAYASIDSAVEAMKRGAFDYLPKPFTHEHVLLLVNKVADVCRLEQKVEALQGELNTENPDVDLVSQSPAMQRILAMARQVADSDATILITGESGTGKTLLARAVHSWSRRAAKPMGVVSCPSLSLDLLESELFGHVKGAFTGALRDNPGRISACEGGTLFLDEIGELPLPLQPKLLRFLQEKAYERLGDAVTLNADVRVLAATNVNLEAAVAAGKFREDLFYRLNVLELVMPPLRERPEDILPIAEKLLVFFARQHHRNALILAEDIRPVLQSYPWPGNIRELRNAIERAVLISSGENIGAAHLPMKMKSVEQTPHLGDLISLEKIEELHIRRVLASTKSLDEAARILGMDSVTLWRRRKQYHM